MTTGGGDVAFESSDGRTLFYTESRLCSRPTDGLYAKPLAGGSGRTLIEKAIRGFAVVEKGIFYLGAAGRDGKLPLLFYDFKTGARRELARVAVWSPALTASPDGTSVLYSASLYSGKDLMLIENFR